MENLINQERLKNLLIELIKIDSLSRKELDVALRLKRDMEALGATVSIDDAGEKVGGNVGNLIAHFPGNVPGSRPLLLSAHMDTVVPGEGIVPILDGNILRTNGTTVLGGDDKSGVAIICEVMRVVQENKIPWQRDRRCLHDLRGGRSDWRKVPGRLTAESTVPGWFSIAIPSGFFSPKRRRPIVWNLKFTASRRTPESARKTA